MRMGVFVAHTIDWAAPSLTSPDDAKREAFLKEIAESVEIAKRVKGNIVLTGIGLVRVSVDGLLDRALRSGTEHLPDSARAETCVGCAPIGHPVNVGQIRGGQSGRPRRGKHEAQVRSVGSAVIGVRCLR